MNWIIPFVAGVFVGQEFQEAPRVRPYIESGIRKVIAMFQEVKANAEKETPTPQQQKDKPMPPSMYPHNWWSKRND